MFRAAAVPVTLFLMFVGLLVLVGCGGGTTDRDLSLRISLSSDKEVLPLNDQDASGRGYIAVITADVTDRYTGSPVADGHVVNVAITRGYASARLYPVGGTAGGDRQSSTTVGGTASFWLVSHDTPGTVEVRASANDPGAAGRAISATKSVIVGGTGDGWYLGVADGGVLTVISESLTLSSGGTASITATLLDNDGLPLADKVIQAVAYDHSLLEVVPSGGADQAVTDASGKVDFDVTDPQVLASVESVVFYLVPKNVTAEAVPVTVNIGVAVGGVLTVVSESLTLSSGGTATITATLMNNAGYPVAGEVIKAVAYDPSLLEVVPSGGAGQDVTDASGKVDFDVTDPQVLAPGASVDFSLVPEKVNAEEVQVTVTIQ